MSDLLILNEQNLNKRWHLNSLALTISACLSVIKIASHQSDFKFPALIDSSMYLPSIL